MILNTVFVLFVNPQPTAYNSLYAEFYTWSAWAALSCGLAYGNGPAPTARLGRRLRVFGHVDIYRPAVLVELNLSIHVALLDDEDIGRCVNFFSSVFVLIGPAGRGATHL